jgi:hypothetical protein
LPFYILNQEGEYPKTWFAANVISKLEIKVVKLYDFLKNLIEVDGPLSTL